jgi:hypothetical protein
MGVFGLDWGKGLPSPGEWKKFGQATGKQVVRPLNWESEHLGKPLAGAFKELHEDINALPPGLREAARIAFGIGAAGTLATVGTLSMGPFGTIAGLGVGAALAHPKSAGAASQLLLPSSLIGFGMPGGALRSLGAVARGLSFLEKGEVLAPELRYLPGVVGRFATYKNTALGRLGYKLEQAGEKLVQAESKAVEVATYPLYKPLAQIWKLGGVIPRRPERIRKVVGEGIAADFWESLGDATVMTSQEFKKKGEDLVFRWKSGQDLSPAEGRIVDLLNEGNYPVPAFFDQTPMSARDGLMSKVSNNYEKYQHIITRPKVETMWNALTKPLRGFTDAWMSHIAPIISIPSAAFLNFAGYAPANALEGLLVMTANGHLSGLAGLKAFYSRGARGEVVKALGDLPGAPAMIKQMAKEEFVVLPAGKTAANWFLSTSLREIQAPISRGLYFMSFDTRYAKDLAQHVPEMLKDLPVLADPKLRYRAVLAAAEGGDAVRSLAPHITTEWVEEGALANLLGKHYFAPEEVRKALVEAHQGGWSVNSDDLINHVSTTYRKLWDTMEQYQPHAMRDALTDFASKVQAYRGRAVSDAELDQLWAQYRELSAAAQNALKQSHMAGQRIAEPLGVGVERETFWSQYDQAIEGVAPEIYASTNEAAEHLLTVPGFREKYGASMVDLKQTWDSTERSLAQWRELRRQYFSKGGEKYLPKKKRTAEFWQGYYADKAAAFNDWDVNARQVWEQRLGTQVGGVQPAVPPPAAPTVTVGPPPEVPAVVGAEAVPLPPLAQPSVLQAKGEEAIRALEQDIRSFFHERPKLKMVADLDRQNLEKYAQVADTLAPAERQQIKDAHALAMKNATDMAALVTVDASNLTIFDGFMRALGMSYFPYEWRRFPRFFNLVRQRPGVAADIYKFYTDASDAGYVRIPNTPMEMSLLRVFGMGPLRAMQLPYWEPEHEGFMGMLERASMDMSKFGFFPISLQIVTAAGTGEIHELLPPALSSLASGFELIPGGPKLAQLMPEIFNEEARDAYTRAQLIDQGIDPTTATEEDMDSVRRSVNLALLASAQLGVTRFRPEMIKSIIDTRAEVAGKYGVPADIIAAAKKVGRNPIYARDENDVPILNRARSDLAIKEVSEKLGITTDAVRAVSNIWISIRPQKQQTVRGYYDEVRRWDDYMEKELLQPIATQVADRKIAPYEWRKKHEEYYTARNVVTRKLLSEFGLVEADLAYDEEAPKHPDDLVAETYYGVEPDTDGNGVATEVEWEMFDQKRKAILAGATPAQREYVLRQYRRIPWRDEVNSNLEIRLRDAKESVNTYFDTPMWKGISLDAQKKITQLQDDEALFWYKIREAVGAPTELMPNNDAMWHAYGTYLLRTHPETLTYFSIANALRRTRVRKALTNPERILTLIRNPDVFNFYPDLANILSEDERLYLGIGPRRTGEEGILAQWQKALGGSLTKAAA